jgi:hypothetical protein
MGAVVERAGLVRLPEALMDCEHSRELLKQLTPLLGQPERADDAKGLAERALARLAQPEAEAGADWTAVKALPDDEPVRSHGMMPLGRKNWSWG